MKGFRTFNPWGHVSKAERAFRQQVAQAIVDQAAGRTWRVWERPEGPEDVDLRRLGLYPAGQWKATFRRAFDTPEAALSALHAYIGGVGIQEVDGEYRKNGMRYLVEQDK